MVKKLGIILMFLFTGIAVFRPCFAARKNEEEEEKDPKNPAHGLGVTGDAVKEISKNIAAMTPGSASSTEEADTAEGEVTAGEPEEPRDPDEPDEPEKSDKPAKKKGHDKRNEGGRVYSSKMYFRVLLPSLITTAAVKILL